MDTPGKDYARFVVLVVCSFGPIDNYITTFFPSRFGLKHMKITDELGSLNASLACKHACRPITAKQAGE